MKFKLSLLIVSTLISSFAHANLRLTPLNMMLNQNAGTGKYRIGDEWGKKKVTSETLKTESPGFARMALATAYLPVGGTGFYLGKFNGSHVVATNHHVCPKAFECVGDRADFRMLGKKFKITKFFITIPDVDLTLLAIDIPESEEAEMSEVARNFSFNQDVYKGQELITMGFGVAGNARNYLMANQDSDCKVFSEAGEYRHMADPDDINPGTYNAWSFANGCDVSHGDSGSAMVDRRTGDIVGIIWTGKIPKSRLAQNSENLDRMLQTSAPEIWKELSYAVPATKIKEYIRTYARSSKFDHQTREVFNALIEN